MRILNIMLGRGKGGIEQAAVDYHEALFRLGHEVMTVLHPDASVTESVRAIGGALANLKPLGEWDILAARRLRKLARQHQADMVICHGNRAIGLALRGLSGETPVIGVAHNYHIKKRFPRCDAVFCITRDLVEEMIHLDMRRDRLFYIPNMVRIAFVPRRTELRSPPVIGTMGRFVAKKGFDIYLHALKALKGLGVPFKAILGGDGEEKATLQKMASEFGLDDVLTFTGWVQDKEAFYKDIDIFVLPSLHEPFGIVLIEAMGAGLPCVTTDTEGPCEIIRHQHDALLVEKAKPYHMAAALRELIENTDAACEMGYLAHLKVRDRYDIHVVEQQIERALTYLASEFLKPISES